jgi:hypothetical protein
MNEEKTIEKEEILEITYLEKPISGFISQVYSSGVQFCFVSEENKQCHSLVYCKDFLQDAIMAQINNCSVSIYGFDFDPSKNPEVCLSKTKILITQKKDPIFSERVEGMLDFINQVCKKMKLKACKVSKTNVPSKIYEHAYLVEGSSKWTNSPPMISMFSLFLRVGLAHKKGDDYLETIEKISTKKVEGYGRQDYSQLNAAKAAIEVILDKGYRKLFYIDTKKNFPKIDISSMHNCSGIGGLSSGSAKAIVPYWNKKLSSFSKPK